MKKMIFGCMLLSLPSIYSMTSVDVTFKRALEREHTDAVEAMAVDAKELQNIYKHASALKHPGWSVKWNLISTQYRNALHNFYYDDVIKLNGRITDFATTLSCFGISLGSCYEILQSTNCNESATKISANSIVKQMTKLRELAANITQIPSVNYQNVIAHPEILIGAVHGLSDEQTVSLIALVPLLHEKAQTRQKLMKCARPYATAIHALDNLTNKLYLCELAAHGKESDQSRAKELIEDAKQKASLQHADLNRWYSTHVAPLYVPNDKNAVRAYYKKLIAVEYAQEGIVNQLSQELPEKHELLKRAREEFEDEGPQLLQRLQNVTAEIEQLAQKCQSHEVAQELISFFEHAAGLSGYAACIEELNDKIQSVALGFFVPLNEHDINRLNLYVVSLSNLITRFNVSA